MTGSTRNRRATLAALALAGSLLGGVLAAGRADAAYTTCRTDPTVYLSNGYVIEMYSDIGTDISNVQHVTYSLHVPAGVYATNIVYDDTGYLESVNVVSDQPAGHGYSDTVVTTSMPSVSVTAYSAIQGYVSGTVSGYSGQHLVLSV